MTLICVSQRIDILPSRNEIRDALDQKLVSFITQAGGIAVPVPNFNNSTIDIETWLNNIKPDGIVLSGGNDIGEYPNRDKVEELLLSYGSKKSLPLLGICRGMQMMGVWGGTTLKSVSGHVATRHILSGDLNMNVNSYHNFSLLNTPDGFSSFAYSQDGEIEAIKHNKLPWEGWMWHPEREECFLSQDIERFKNLLS